MKLFLVFPLCRLLFNLKLYCRLKMTLDSLCDCQDLTAKNVEFNFEVKEELGLTNNRKLVIYKTGAKRSLWSSL